MRSSAICLLLLSATRLWAQTPTVSGVADAATFQAPVAPGSLVSIFGAHLAVAPAAASSIPLPDSLGGVSVRFNGIAAPLLYVSPGQINAQLPWKVDAAAAISVVVSNSAGSSDPAPVSAAIAAPGFYSASGQAVALNLDGALTLDRPATPGDSLILYASGLGPVSPAAPTGGNSLDQLRPTITTPKVLLGGVPVPVSFSGLSPQFVGVYQLNIAVPADFSSANAASLQIQVNGAVSPPTQTTLSVGGGWPQWGQNAQHTGALSVSGQSPDRILANTLYDSLTQQEKDAAGGELTVHYQVPLADGADVYMEAKSGSYSLGAYATQTWGQTKYSWKNGQLAAVWTVDSDWKAPGSISDFWEPVFHAVLANDSLYMPGASGSIIQVRKADGTVARRIAPFGTDPSVYVTGPLVADAHGAIYYNAIQITYDPAGGFYSSDATDSWLVKVTPDGTATKVSYKLLTSPEAPSSTAQCQTTFLTFELPWPPSPAAVPGTALCGTQRIGLNQAPAIAPDGTIYGLTRAHFNDRYSFLVAVNPDLSKKWVASLRDRLHDGCGVPVSAGGSLPANGSPGGCRAGAAAGVDPATNRPGAGRVSDSASSTVTIAPDGSVLYGALTVYNYQQGHLMRFDAQGNYMNSFGFGWDSTPAIYSHDGTWSIVIKNNHYGDTGSYCQVEFVCPHDRNASNPASPEQYFLTQLSPDMTIEWSYQNNNADSCSRNADGSLACVSDHPFGFEWCVNAPAVDANGVVYANSEDGNLYAIGQGGVLLKKLFQQLAIGAAYTPASIGGDGKIYSQNDGHLFVAGK